ncbi:MULTISPECIES: hypothetical protein [unclassified Leucobacter]|uniref:hypothetical protein n=1 Tax=unclassified Leucobacter TaxID=2621730 RepID=UPI00301A6054
MKESAADKVDFVTGVAAQAALSAIPVVGGPLSVILAGSIEAAGHKRNARILRELSEELARLRDHLPSIDLDEFVQSEQFIANLTMVVRAIQETSNEELIASLKQALLSGVNPQNRDYAEVYTKSLVRMSNMQTEVLSAIYKDADRRPHWIEGGTLAVRNKLSARGIQRPLGFIEQICGQLASEGYLQLGEPEKSDEGNGDSALDIKCTVSGMKFYEFITSG